MEKHLFDDDNLHDLLLRRKVHHERERGVRLPPKWTSFSFVMYLGVVPSIEYSPQDTVYALNLSTNGTCLNNTQMPKKDKNIEKVLCDGDVLEFRVSNKHDIRYRVRLEVREATT